jgi:DnaJ-class molecular chaperone
MPDDYYQTLGVKRNASADEIQKAYRRLARKYHPDLADDKDAAKEKFQKIQHAYDVLSDPQKKELYDRYGSEFAQGRNPFQGGQMPNGMDMEQIFGRGQMPPGGFEEILKQVFGAAATQAGRRGGTRGGFPGGDFPGAGFGGRRHGQPPPGPTRGQDVEQTITIPFATAILGGKHQLSLQRSDGRLENITVTIPAGITDGKKIRLRGQGRGSSNRGPRGDMIITVKVAPHPVFQRSGENLLVELPITIAEAARGAKIDLPTPHGEVTITVPPGSSGGKRLRLKGMGIRRAKGTASDLLVELRIVIPEKLSEAQQKLLQDFCDSITETDPRAGISW